MKSDVDFTLGFSRSMVATGTPLFVEITPKVSPACTVQNRLPVGLPLTVVVPAVDVTAMCLRGTVGTVTGACPASVPASSPARIRRTAIVAASRNAAGATKRRQSRRPATSRTRSRSPA